MTRICTDCKQNKDSKDFVRRKNPNKTTTKYYSSVCKTCASKRSRLWMINNRERFNAYQRNYQKRIKKENNV